MADRQILFSKPMILAMLAGRKTMTRRTIKTARVFATPETPAFTLKGEDMARALQNASRFRHIDGNGWFWESDAFAWQAPAERTGWMAHIGYAPEDRLWVREAGSLLRHADYNDPNTGRDVWHPHGWEHAADGEIVGYLDNDSTEYIGDCSKTVRPSIFMPRWASRLTLIVEDVKVERLQDISEADAIAEGIEPFTDFRPYGHHWKRYRDGGWNGYVDNPIGSYASLWTEINGAGSWEQNPWIYAVSFRVIPQNIDQIARAA